LRSEGAVHIRRHLQCRKIKAAEAAPAAEQEEEEQQQQQEELEEEEGEGGAGPAEEYEVDHIVGKRTADGEVECRVRWLGYAAEDDTWEPLAHLESVMHKVRHNKQTAW
jgi:hypothetical protein